ncbi:MAG: hypothetical protein HAW63_05700, partial [Bdellovibrionaceae bacterium]|nr:hypothetical protein [Pseudobdellovibrionaceae bacterium]
MKTTQKILMALVSLTLCLMLASCKATTSPPGSGVSELIPPDGGTDREIDEKTDEEIDEEISEEISEEDADINVPDKNKLASDLNRLRTLLKSSYAQAITAIGSVAFTNRPGELAVYLETSGIDGT